MPRERDIIAAMRLKRRLSTVRLMWAAANALREQQTLIRQLAAERDATELAYMRISRDLIEQFLISLDTPETQDEIRRRLHTALGFYRDEIAVKEEQIG